jgi:phosphate starvation-inducible PhoH-like protein
MKINTCVLILFFFLNSVECFIYPINIKISHKFLMAKNKEFNIYTPKTDNQKKYDNILDKDDDYVLSVIGPPGTGKTLLSCVKAIQKLKENKIDKIIITRPIISVEDENIGFLPGNLEKKMDPWTRPIYDVFLDFYSKAEINNMIINNKIEISPLGYMRGRTFKNSFILADEMQNSTPNQMLMLLTRIGINSKIVITGDLHQSDIASKNGLEDLVFRLKHKNISNNFHLIEMNDSDIQRSNTVINILKLYDDKENVDTNFELVKIPEKKFTLNYTDFNFKRNIMDQKIELMKINKINNITLNFRNFTVKNDDAALIPLKDISKHFPKNLKI